MTTPVWAGDDGNAAYLDKTLRYNQVELGFDESVSGKFLFFLWLRASVVSWLASSILLVPAVIILLTSLSGPSYSGSYYRDGGSSGLDAVGPLFTIGSILSFVVFWVVLLTYRQPEPIAEWRVLLADRSGHAESVYSAVSGTLGRRQLPLTWSVRRIRTGYGSVSHRLVVVDRYYTAYVSVFGYGSSLYLGWMMWRSRRGYQLIGRFFADLFSGMSARRDVERQMMRTEPARAMREAVHAACREGLYVAMEGRDVPPSYGFPNGLPPIEDADHLAVAPIPAGPPMPPPAGPFPTQPDGSPPVHPPSGPFPTPPAPPSGAQSGPPSGPPQSGPPQSGPFPAPPSPYSPPGPPTPPADEPR